MTDREILPAGLKPTHYDLRLYDINVTSFTFAGTVTIDYQPSADVEAIYLNARGLEIKNTIVNAEITKTQSSIQVKNTSYDKTAEVVKIELAEKIASGASKVSVTLEYSGVIQDNMAGFYRSKYKDADGKDAVMLSTQFESTDARRAFPCADEPNLKATFDLSITIPEQWTALSNMPVISSKAPEDGKKSAGPAGTSLKTVTFATTPVMSTYLLAWAAGDFEYIEAFTEKSYNGHKIPVRVYTTKGLVEQGRLALESAAKIIDYFSKVFDIDYVLPKADLLAVHEFSHGAMENWGLVTYRTTAVLFDPAKSSALYKSRVVYVVAHELAHQWFGNLVTMDWWNELWLNEGFATWVGWLAVDYLYPEWNVYSRFVTETLQGALGLDSLRQSHPIEVPVRSALDIDQIFDHISYLKGASVIHMLATFLGVETFLKGVSAYLKKHAFANAHTTDLWASISEVAGWDVGNAMKNWTSKIGFPLVTVSELEDGKVKLQQDRFLKGGDVTDEENTTVWWIPLSVSSGADPEAKTSVSIDALDSKEITLDGLTTATNDFFKLNKNQTGVYRVNYSAERLAKFGKSIDKLSANDKIGLLADAAATASAGVGSISGLLSFIQGLADDTDYAVWSEILTTLSSIRSVWFEQSEEDRTALAKFTESLVLPLIKKLGWEFSESEDFLQSQLRTLAISSAGGVNATEVVAESKARFAKWQAGDADAIAPSLRSAVYSTVLRSSTGAELTSAYDSIVDQLVNPPAVDSREIALVALGKVRDPDAIKRSFDLVLSDKVAVQDVHSLLNSLATNPQTRWQTWEFVKANWEQIYAKFSTNMVVLDRLVRLVLNKFASKKAGDDIEAFYAKIDTHGFERSLGQALDTIKSNTEWVARDASAVRQWLKDNQYLTAKI